MGSSAPEPSASDTTEPVDLALSNPQSLHHAVYARRAEYTRPHRIRIKIGTWNVAASPGTDKDLASWFLDGKGIDSRLAALDLSHDAVVETQTSESSVGPGSLRLLGGDKIGLYILGLQEVVNLNPVTQYVYSDSNPTDKWRLALEAALPPGYGFVASEQMSGLLLLMYASPEVKPSIGNISTKVIGTGVGGWFGNKGATVARLVLGEATKMVFVNAHLSSGSDAATVERRCWDARTILDRTRFDPIVRAGGEHEENQDKIGDEDFVFWFGDLNFRLDSIPGDDIRRLLMLHTRGQYDVSKQEPENLDGEEGIIVMRSSESSDEQTDGASSRTRSTDQSSDDESVSLPDPDDFECDPHGDPTSLQATLDSLLPHDQLLRIIKERKVFHDGWHEGPITFLPSYKYDVGTVGLFDSSEKKRAPSWCDRILYRTKSDRQKYQQKLKEEAEARARDEEMKARGMDAAGDDDEVLFDYDPDSDGDNTPVGKPGLDYDEYDEDGDDAGASTGQEDDMPDRIKLEIYTSHQRVTSSDHKPVVAIFTVDFDAVVPELKAEVHAEVARDLDRAENEGRPSITIASEGAPSSSHDNSIDFGEMRFLEKQTTSFTLANTGGVAATISFVEKPAAPDLGEASSDLAQWLTASFFEVGNEVTLEPGETVNAVLEVLIDKVAQARILNDGRADLEEVLVLRVTDGKDHFIPVRATWLPTCVGRCIDELIRVPDGGIRAFIASLSEIKGQKHLGAIPHDSDVHRSAPKELFKLIEALEVMTARTLADEQMLESYTVPRDKHGWPFEDFVAGPHDHLVASVFDILDTDRPIADAFSPDTNPCQKLETLADALLLFLRGLTDGIISMPLWSKIEQAPIRALGQAPPNSSTVTSSEAAEDDRMAVLDVLTNAPNHNICFVFLTTTLATVLGELAPLKRSEAAAAATAAAAAASPTAQAQPTGAMGAIGALGRRSLSFRRSLPLGSGASGASPAAEAVAALERRKGKERRIAQMFGSAVCRAPVPAREKERKALEGKQTTVVELFLRGREGD